MVNNTSIFASDEELKKKEIIQACLRIVDKYGIKGATIKKIAAEVGVVESALYRHFSSKKDIFLKILKETSKVFESIINDVEKLDVGALKKLELILKKQLEFLRSYPGLIRIVYSDEIYMRDNILLDKLDKFLNKLIAKIEKIIKQGVEQKMIKPNIDSFVASINFLGIIQMSFSYWSLRSRKAPLPLISKNLLLNFFNGIKA